MTRARPTIAVVAIALAAVGATGCGIPTSASPTPISKSDVPYLLLNPSTPTTVPSTVPTAATVNATIFLVTPSQTVFPVLRKVKSPADLSEILGALLAGPTSVESRFGLQSFLTGAKTTVKATVVGGIATVDFTSDPVQVVGNDQTLAIAQVVYTATQQPGVVGVLFQSAGQPIEVPTASGSQVPGPVNRTSYLPQAPIQ